MKKDKSTLCIIETDNTDNVKILFNKITGLPSLDKTGSVIMVNQYWYFRKFMIFCKSSVICLVVDDMKSQTEPDLFHWDLVSSIYISYTSKCIPVTNILELEFVFNLYSW